MIKSNKKISLAKLLKGLVEKEVIKSLTLKKIEIEGLKLDSRKVAKGDLFLAYPGVNLDGRDYIAMAIENGASAIVAEADGFEVCAKNLQDLLDDNQQETDHEKVSVKVVPVPNLAQKVSHIAGKFYGNPTKKMSLVGITGTNGKTSIAYLSAQVLDFLQKPTLLLSTLGNGDVKQLENSDNTTPDAVTIQQLAASFFEDKYRHACMEVSSHGLVQGRVSGLNYQVAVFTNLSRDHLEYHGDMESYFQAKRQLFLREELSVAIINADDEYGIRLLEDSEISCKKIAYSRRAKQTDLNIDDWVLATNEVFNLNGIQASLQTPWGSGRLNSELLGDFNLSNLLAVAAVLGSQLGSIEKWIIGLNAAKPVLGRMQQFQQQDLATVVVDYAHTPDALEKALQTLRHHCTGDIWCLFGCGGDRDSGKRALMGKAVADNADRIIITDDNPRTENAAEIVSMIRQGLEQNYSDESPYIASRKEAIEFALKQAAANDMILVAGKGHEDYQEIGQEKRHYSDLETVKALMEQVA